MTAQHYSDSKAYNYVISQFKVLDISLDRIAEEARTQQLRHHTTSSLAEYKRVLLNILHKREILNYIMCALYLDQSARERALPEPLQTVMDCDSPLFGADEAIANGMCSLYGTIAGTNFGYLDVVKTGLAKEVDSRSEVYVFLDDVVSALVACTEAKIASEEG
mgnify:CR=1 FL=1